MVEEGRTSSPPGALQRASVACHSCRQRKVKCDAQSAQPGEKCSPCRRAGQDCLLDPLSDGRRSVSQRIVDKLQQRIATLEALNSNHIAGERSTWVLDDRVAIPARNPFTPASSSRNSNIARAVGQPPAQSSQALSPPPPPLAHSSPESASGESPSYYGATSHPHVVSPSEESHVSCSDEMDMVEIDLDPDSPSLRDQLLRFFFKYQTLWVDVVEMETFLAHKANGKNSRWYSKFLENAILACGARLSTSKAVRVLGARYCALARDDAMSAMSDPSPANMQGFLLLSEYEVSQGNDRPGWMFCGVACRMLSDLGLHDLANATGPPLVNPEQIKESNLAYGLASACVVYEGVWTLYLGRPSSIPRSVMSIVASRCKQNRQPDSPWRNAWVGLCIPMAEISLVINEQMVDDADRTASLRKLAAQVDQWHQNLPPELAYNENRLAGMDLAGYGLHTQYCKLQIFLQKYEALPRPHNARKRQHSQMMGDSTSRGPPDASKNMYQYALRIARLVVTYRETFGVENIPSIMLDNAVVAATTLVEHVNNAESGAEVQQQKTWLRHLVKSMENVQLHFPVVTRMLDFLKQMDANGSLRPVVSPALPIFAIDTPAPVPRATASVDLNFRSNNYPTEFDAMGNSPGAFWGLDTGISSTLFSSGGFGDFVLDLASSEALASNLAQAVP